MKMATRHQLYTPSEQHINNMKASPKTNATKMIYQLMKMMKLQQQEHANPSLLSV